MSQDKRVAAAIARVPSMAPHELKTLRQNALRAGDEAAPLIAAIDERLKAFDTVGGMAIHRLEFARQMLRVVERGRPGQWQEGISVFQQAMVENPDNAFVVSVRDNSARAIPLTKALEEVLPDFPNIERDKDPQSGRVSWRLTR